MFAPPPAAPFVCRVALSPVLVERQTMRGARGNGMRAMAELIERRVPCDDSQLAALQAELDGNAEFRASFLLGDAVYVPLVAERSAPAEGSGFSSLCIRTRDEKSCARDFLRGNVFRPIEVKLSAGPCNPIAHALNRASEALGKSDSEGALTRARDALIRSGYFSEVELLTAAREGMTTPVIVLLGVADYESLCLAAGLPATGGELSSSGAACPANPGCTDTNCHKRPDGCTVCTCASQLDKDLGAVNDTLRKIFKR
jgi:hypothetical protein